MTITNDERREVARNMRKLSEHVYDENSTYEFAADAVGGVCNTAYLFERLADLIEPEGKTMANNDLSRAVEFLRTADCRHCTCDDCQEASSALFGEGNENALCSIDDNGDAKPWRRLAYLIEPDERTCRMRDARWDDGQCTWGCICSECGAKHEHKQGKWLNFCPNCGARVVEP